MIQINYMVKIKQRTQEKPEWHFTGESLHLLQVKNLTLVRSGERVAWLNIAQVQILVQNWLKARQSWFFCPSHVWYNDISNYIACMSTYLSAERSHDSVKSHPTVFN